MEITPVGNRVLVRLDKSPETFGGGRFVIADVPDRDGDYRPKPARGTVLACGPRVVDLKVGDYIICDKYHGVELPMLAIKGLDEGHLFLIKEPFVMARRENEGSAS